MAPRLPKRYFQAPHVLFLLRPKQRTSLQQGRIHLKLRLFLCPGSPDCFQHLFQSIQLPRGIHAIYTDSRVNRLADIMQRPLIRSNWEERGFLKNSSTCCSSITDATQNQMIDLDDIYLGIPFAQRDNMSEGNGGISRHISLAATAVTLAWH